MRWVRSCVMVVALVGAAGCGSDEPDEAVSADQIQRDTLEKVWLQGDDRARAILCRQFRKDPAGFARDFTEVGKDSVVREFFEDECGT